MNNKKQNDYNYFVSILSDMAEKRNSYHKDKILLLLGDHPWDRDTLASLYFKNTDETRKAVRSLAGFKIVNLYTTIEKSFQIFESCITDLLNSISIYKNSKRLFCKAQFKNNKMDDITKQTNKYIFTSAAAASLLFLQQMKIKNKRCIDSFQYDTLTTNIWGDDGLFSIVKDIRDAMSHGFFISPEYTISYNKGSKTIKKFLIDKNKFLTYNIKQPSKKYISEHSSLCSELPRSKLRSIKGIRPRTDSSNQE